MISYSILRVAVLVLLLSGSTHIFAQDARPARSSSDDRSPTLSPAQNASRQATTAPGNGDQQNTTATSTQAKQPIVPLSSRQKLAYGARMAFLDPWAYFGPAVDGYFTERRDVKAPGQTGDDKFADGASDYARSFATNTPLRCLAPECIRRFSNKTRAIILRENMDSCRARSTPRVEP